MPISNKKLPAIGRPARVCVTAISIFAALTSASLAQTQLKDYTDAKGYVNVSTLTCADLAGTYHEDANFLAVWYSGWLNGRAKKHSFNLERTEAGLKAVISYCQGNPTKTLGQAAGTALTGQ